MEAIRCTVRVRSDGTLEWPDPPPSLPTGEAELILLPAEREQSPSSQDTEPSEKVLALNWPRLTGGDWREDALRREELYGDKGR